MPGVNLRQNFAFVCQPSPSEGLEIAIQCYLESSQQNMWPQWALTLIWSHDTGQWIPCWNDSCQLTITWMSNIKDVPMVMVLLSFIFLRYDAPFTHTQYKCCSDVYYMDVWTITWQPQFFSSMSYQIFHVMGLHSPSRSSAINKIIREQRKSLYSLIYNSILPTTPQLYRANTTFTVVDNTIFSLKANFLFITYGTSSSLLKRNGSSIALALGDSCKTTSKMIKRILLLISTQ